MQTLLEVSELPAAEFNSKHPHNTLWLEIGYEQGKRPVDLEKALQAAGWKTQDTRELPPVMNSAGQRVTSFIMTKDGTGLFGGWTPVERKVNTTKAREVLRKHGISKVPAFKLSLADLL